MVLKPVRILVVVCTLLLLTVIAVGCGQTGNSKSSETKSTETKSTETKSADTTPIKIGVLATLSGPKAAYGEPAVQGATIAAEEINNNGGINGRKIELMVRDDEGKPATGVVETQGLINNEKIVGMVGPTFSAVGVASAQYLNEAKVPNLAMIVFKEFTDQTKFPYSFRWAVLNTFYSKTIVDYAIKNKITKIGIIADTTELGISGTKVTIEYMQSKGLKPVAVESMNPGTLDLTSQMKRMKNSGAQAYIAWAVGMDVVRIIKAKQQIGWKDGIGFHAVHPSQSIVEGAGLDALENIYTADMKAFVDPPTEKTQKLLDGLKGKYGKIIDIDVSTKYYDMVIILAEAIKKAGSTDGEAVKAALENLGGFEANMGIVRYSKESHEGVTADDITLTQAKTLREGLTQLAPGAN